MQNLNQKIKSILYPILFWAIFIIVPFILLRFTMVFKDFGFYFIYSVLIFPFILIMFLSVYAKKFKKSIRNYKKILLLFLFGSILTYLFLFIYIYQLIVEAFRNSSFPF